MLGLICLTNTYYGNLMCLVDIFCVKDYNRCYSCAAEVATSNIGDTGKNVCSTAFGENYGNMFNLRQCNMNDFKFFWACNQLCVMTIWCIKTQLGLLTDRICVVGPVTRSLSSQNRKITWHSLMLVGQVL